MCQRRWKRKWNGCTSYVCQTTFITSGASVGGCQQKIHGVFTYHETHSIILSVVQTRNATYGRFSTLILLYCIYFSLEQDALRETLGLQLVGPFDILSERHKDCSNTQPNYHLHCRYFYDPPELQTILQGSAETQYHMGYFRLDIFLDSLVWMFVLVTPRYWYNLIIKRICSPFRDSPEALPVCIGENEAKKGYSIKQMGDNLFGAVL